MPSGIVRTDKLPIIGNGVVVVAERVRGASGYANQGVDVGPVFNLLKVSPGTPAYSAVAWALDIAREKARGSAAKIGTTGRGIGPAYEDKVARRAIRVCDLGDKATLAHKIDMLLQHHDALRRGMEMTPVDRDGLIESLDRDRAQTVAMPNRSGAGWPTCADAGVASCSKARRRISWTSITAPIRS